VLVTLVKTKQDCLKKLLKTVRTNTPDLWARRAASSRPSDRRSQTPDGHMCWDDSGVQWAGDGLQNADEAEKRRRKNGWNRGKM